MMLGFDLPRILVLLAIFASAFLAMQIALRVTVEGRAHAGAVNKRLKMIAKGVDRENVISLLRKNDPMQLRASETPWGRLYFSFRRNLSMAAVPLSARQVMFGMLVLFAVLVLAVSAATFAANYSPTAGVIQVILAFSAATAIGIPVLIVGFIAQRRRKKMQEQFPNALDIFVRSLRAGHPVSGALELLTHEMEDPIGSEFGLVTDEIAYGADLTDALNDMAERWDLEDIRIFVVSISIQNETGGNLAEILDNLSRVIRERANLYLKVRALSSEGRMTGWMLVALPVLAFVLVFSLRPSFYLDVAGDPIFFLGFPLMLLWYFAGIITIRKMVNLKV